VAPPIARAPGRGSNGSGAASPAAYPTAAVSATGGWLEHVSDASQSTTDAARRELTDAELEELEPEAFKGDET